MSLLLDLAPILFVILLGFFCARLNLFDQEASTVLSRLLFFVVMPITLFFDLATLPISGLFHWGYLVGFFLSYLCLSGLSMLCSFFVFKRKGAELIINGMASAHTNTAYLALPVFIVLFHSTVAVSGIIFVQAIFNFLIILGLQLSNATQARKTMAQTFCAVFLKTPILIGVFLGVLVSLLQLHLPELMTSSCQLIQQSAPALALLALGLSLGVKQNPFSSNEKWEVLFLVCLKSLVHPIVAWVIGRFVFHLDPIWLGSLILMAAMPAPKNLFVFARRYQVALGRAHWVVLFSTLLSIVVINLMIFSGFVAV